jgi:hypothetical protein
MPHPDRDPRDASSTLARSIARSIPSERNGSLRFSYRYPFATRKDGAAFCEEFRISIRAREKYAHQGWKEVRTCDHGS